MQEFNFLIDMNPDTTKKRLEKKHSFSEFEKHILKMKKA